MSSRRLYRVKEVADLARISIRTLHHYDELGLLRPSSRRSTGYRLYSEEDLLRLQRILLARELGFSLAEIQRSLDDPNFDARQALLEHRKALTKRIEETTRMIEAVDRALELLATPEGDIMTHRQLFDGFDPSKYEAEAKERWGETEAYKESMRRAQSYTPEDWRQIRAEQDGLFDRAASLAASGADPTGAEALELAENHRQSIDRWFYPCDLTLHGGLADLYENDPRFQQNLDRHGPGTARFLAAAIRANGERRRDG